MLECVRRIINGLIEFTRRHGLQMYINDLEHYDGPLGTAHPLVLVVTVTKRNPVGEHMRLKEKIN